MTNRLQSDYTTHRFINSFRLLLVINGMVAVLFSPTDWQICFCYRETKTSGAWPSRAFRSLTGTQIPLVYFAFAVARGSSFLTDGVIRITIISTAAGTEEIAVLLRPRTGLCAACRAIVAPPATAKTQMPLKIKVEKMTKMTTTTIVTRKKVGLTKRASIRRLLEDIEVLRSECGRKQAFGMSVLIWTC